MSKLLWTIDVFSSGNSALASGRHALRDSLDPRSGGEPSATAARRMCRAGRVRPWLEPVVTRATRHDSRDAQFGCSKLEDYAVFPDSKSVEVRTSVDAFEFLEVDSARCREALEADRDSLAHSDFQGFELALRPF
jgi:hypothetical protein